MRTARPAGLSAVVFATLASALASASSLEAQNAECGGYPGNAQRVCDAGLDATRAFHPLAGLLVSGGNPVIGTGNTLGGLGHGSFTVRANAVEVVLPDLEYDGSSATVSADDKLWAPAPLVEGAVGLFGGMAGGLFSLDVLGSAQLLPTDQIDNIRVDESARSIGGVALGLGVGVRLGVLRERGPLPGLSVSYMRRNIPQISYGDVGEGDDYAYAVDLKATNVRVVASKKLLLLNLAAGFGWDRYTGDASIQFVNPITTLAEPPIDLELDNTRTLAFGNAGLELGPVKLVGEAGYQSGKDQQLTTDFEDFDTTKGKFFAGLGLRLGF